MVLKNLWMRFVTALVNLMDLPKLPKKCQRHVLQLVRLWTSTALELHRAHHALICALQDCRLSVEDTLSRILIVCKSRLNKKGREVEEVPSCNYKVPLISI